MSLENKVAVITGGGLGIGKEYCLGLAKEGAGVVVADIDFEAANNVALEIERAGGKALAVRTDVSDEAGTIAMAKKTAECFGRIDVLVNNAGLFTALGGHKPFMELSVADWDRTMAVNVKGLFLCVRAVYPYMKAQGKGKIVNIGSTIASEGGAGHLHYGTSKGAVLSFTRNLARELADDNITVNTLSPGMTTHEAVIAKKGMTQDRIDRMVKSRCVHKDMVPRDLVGTLVFLASDDSDMVCGQNIIVDGGFWFA